MVSAAGVALVASAEHLPVVDQADTRGPLDIRRASIEGQRRPRWKVATWEGWSRPRIFDSGYVMVRLDTFGRARADYYVLVGSSGDRLYADLWRDRTNEPDVKRSAVAVWRPGWKSVAVKVPLARLRIGSDRAFYRWSVETIFTGPACPRVCFDLAPDEGTILEPLPFPTPTPTPSVTETPTPEPTD